MGSATRLSLIQPTSSSSTTSTINLNPLNPELTPIIDQLHSSSSKDSAYIAGISRSAKSQPIHTDEMFSDHTGESARVAGIAKPIHMDNSTALASLSSSTTNMNKVMESKLREAKDTADRVIEKMELEAREFRLSAQQRSQEIADTAKELINRLRTFADEGEVKAKQFSSRIEKEAKDILPKEFADILNRMSKSVSFPMPEKIQVPMNASVKNNTNGQIKDNLGSSSVSSSKDQATGTINSSTTVTASTSVSNTSTNVQTTYGPTKQRTPSDELFPLSNEPVIEVIPTRRLKTGTVVPMYLEAPLRIKPPDHEYLTYDEAVEEEVVRLQLYSDIATRIHDSLLILQDEVMTYRKEKGWIERRSQS